MIAAPQSATRQCRGGQIEHRRTTMKRHGRLVAGFVLLALAVGLVAPAPAQEKPWWPFPVEDRDPPFNMEGKKVKKDYVPIDHAAKKWNMCVSFPHMKDAYWIAVDYGVVSESRRLGVKMQLVEAGGYTDLPNQNNHIEGLVFQGGQAGVLGVSARTGLANVIGKSP